MEDHLEETEFEREDKRDKELIQPKTIAKQGPKAKIRRKAWQPHEDEQLMRLIEIHGMKWAKIASIMKDRTGKQIRDRYLNNLNPEIREKDWTPEEDKLLLFLYFNWGKKWSKIAASLPGRSEGQVKNRFYWELKRRGLCYPFVDLNHVQTSINPHLQHLINPNGTINEIPRISMAQTNHGDSQNIYWDYPNALKATNLIKESSSNSESSQPPNPDDFISYNDSSDLKSSFSRSYTSYTPNEN